MTRLRGAVAIVTGASRGFGAHYVASVHAAKIMIQQRSGLIVTVSFWAAQKFMGSPAYGAAKAADDKLAREYGFTDIDGTSSRPLTLADV